MKVGFIWGHLSDPGCLAVLGTLSILGSPRASCLTLYQKHIFLMCRSASVHSPIRSRSSMSIHVLSLVRNCCVSITMVSNCSYMDRRKTASDESLIFSQHNAPVTFPTGGN